MAGPVRDGGEANLVFGLAEYADGEADRTFRTYKCPQMAMKSRVRENLRAYVPQQ